jgi:hypothetical protein
VPVYVWDLDTERQLLLDRFHQVSNLITWHLLLCHGLFAVLFLLPF